MEPKIPLHPLTLTLNQDSENDSQIAIKLTYWADAVSTEYGNFFKYTIHLDDDTTIEAYARSQNRAKAILFQKLSEHFLERAKNV